MASLGHELRNHLQSFQLCRSPFVGYVMTKEVTIEITISKRKLCNYVVKSIMGVVISKTNNGYSSLQVRQVV